LRIRAVRLVASLLAADGLIANFLCVNRLVAHLLAANGLIANLFALRLAIRWAIRLAIAR
jgi:hypothetical protein